MKPLRIPGDPAKAVKNHLAAVLPSKMPAPAPTVGLVLPAGWTTKSVPAVVVFDDSGPVAWPVSTSPTIRVTVWADGRDRSRTIAAVALGLLLAGGVPDIATITEPSGLLEARDSNNAGILTSFTFRAQSRTLPA
ncbi:hypothetical protein [Nocardia acidivorans]|uniref:hypothetical protein n=1 Tax=Nocardia acidivorans TaxID=404580 RepID=UPI00082AFDF1|nr:hypothetical protein [Nocardia acidivorans]